MYHYYYDFFPGQKAEKGGAQTGFSAAGPGWLARWCNQSAQGAGWNGSPCGLVSVRFGISLWAQVGRKLMFFNLQVCVLSLSFRPATHRQKSVQAVAKRAGMLCSCCCSPEMSLKRHTEIFVCLGVRGPFDLSLSQCQLAAASPADRRERGRSA